MRACVRACVRVCVCVCVCYGSTCTKERESEMFSLSLTCGVCQELCVGSAGSSGHSQKTPTLAEEAAAVAASQTHCSISELVGSTRLSFLTSHNICVMEFCHMFHSFSLAQNFYGT